jgi:hypothetical protein
VKVSLLLLALLLAAPAFADIIPDHVGACWGKEAGAACTTPDGQRGTCQKVSVGRLVYSFGIRKIKPVKMLGCLPAGGAPKARSLLPLVGLGLALLALVAALGLCARRTPQPT